MAELGRFSDNNLARVGSIAGGSTWSVDLPLANLLDDARYVVQPARNTDPSNLAQCYFDFTLERARLVSLIGVVFHTFTLDAQYRLTLAGIDGSLGSPIYQSPWTRVYPRLQSTSQVAWEEPQWWTGEVTQEDIDLYPRHLFVPLTPPQIISALRLEFNDEANPAGFFDVGGLWVASSWSPTFNFVRGRELRYSARDQEDEGPSGRLFFEQRRGRRVINFNWDNLTDAEARRAYDAGVRAGRSKVVLFVPDLEDWGSLVREAFPAGFVEAPSVKFQRPYQNATNFQLREIIA